MSGLFNFSGIRQGLHITRDLKNSFLAAWEALAFHLDDGMSPEEERIHLGSVSVVRMVLSDDEGRLIPGKLDTFRRLLESECDTSEVEQQIVELKRLVPLESSSAAEALALMRPEDRERLLHFILSLAAATSTSAQLLESLRGIFAAAGVDEAAFDTMYGEARKSEERRQRIIGSGAGILAALVVILVFIITATLLKSVIFGLILAYLLLPLEKFFERRQREKRGIAYYLFRLIALPVLPLRLLSQRIMRRAAADNEPDGEEKTLTRERHIITQAVAQTALTVLIILSVVICAVSNMTARYVSGWRSSRKNTTVRTALSATPSSAENAEVKKAEADAGNPNTDNVAAAGNGTDFAMPQLLQKIDDQLRQYQDKFQKLPLVKLALDHVASVLRDENSRRDLLSTLLKRSGGIFHFTASVLGAVASAVGDLLLTVFFALLFLIKIAEFCREDESSGRKSEYLVRTVFNGNWLPDANDATIGEAKRIVGGIMDRLRIWARGYLTLIMVDAAVYTTVFFFLRVPYFPLLGLIAGCGILLPYVGPVISASLTVLVTLAVGDCSGIQLVGIIIAYLLYNGIVEQFILYPAVIGESLGLTTLETIVVVLLGAVFAGIPGMFLALPAASVLKYIIPQIHHYLRLRRGTDAAR